jgi:hypothetical protein
LQPAQIGRSPLTSRTFSNAVAFRQRLAQAYFGLFTAADIGKIDGQASMRGRVDVKLEPSVRCAEQMLERYRYPTSEGFLELALRDGSAEVAQYLPQGFPTALSRVAPAQRSAAWFR